MSGGRSVAETAQLHAVLEAQGLSFEQIAERLGVKPRSLEEALRRHRYNRGQARLDGEERERLRAELAAWHRAGCPL